MKKILLFFAISVLTTNSIYQQERISNNFGCGTVFTKANNFNSLQKSSRTFSINTPVSIPLKAHIVRNSDGTGGLSESVLNNTISDLNTKYSPLDITFYLCEEINYIDNSNYYDFHSSEEDSLAEPTELLQVINIYFTNTVQTVNDGFVGGYAHFPINYLGSNQNQETNRILIANSSANGSTVAHEIGHFFSLRHTHGLSNHELTDELVDGSNCATAGDGFCDTPADPNLAGLVGSGCVYTGNITDANGDAFNPLTNNLMSYSPSACRDLFTEEQQTTILQSLANERNYLACNENYSVQYTCDDLFEPSEEYYQATNYYGITDNFEESHCLSANDIDWIAEVEVNGEHYYIKVEGVNNSFGAYKVSLVTDNGIMTIETESSTMLNTDTKLFLYGSDATTLLVEDDNSGGGDFSKIIYDTTLSTQDEFLKNLTVFPNPTSDFINISSTNKLEIDNISIYNIFGQLIKDTLFKDKIDISHFSNGVYFLSLSTQNNQRIIYKIIKK